MSVCVQVYVVMTTARSFSWSGETPDLLFVLCMSLIPLILQAWLLSLLSAQKDWRLALLRLGHLHQLGEHGIPPDSDLAYAYYSNIAKQTSSDHHNPSPQQVGLCA